MPFWKGARLNCRFPGPPASYNYAVDMTDVDLLVEAEEWLATNVKPDTANTAFNITNGDVTRWKHVRRVSKLKHSNVSHITTS